MFELPRVLNHGKGIVFEWPQVSPLWKMDHLWMATGFNPVENGLSLNGIGFSSVENGLSLNCHGFQPVDERKNKVQTLKGSNKNCLVPKIKLIIWGTPSYEFVFLLTKYLAVFCGEEDYLFKSASFSRIQFLLTTSGVFRTSVFSFSISFRSPAVILASLFTMPIVFKKYFLLAVGTSLFLVR